MRILAVNCGSSSLKFKLLDLSAGDSGQGVPKMLAHGAVQIGSAGKLSFQETGGPSFTQNVSVPDHAAAVRFAGQWIEATADLSGSIGAVGHRVVHGGDAFDAPTLIDDHVLRSLDRLRDLAPLHNGPALEAIRACRSLFSDGCPMVATFDTAFHKDLPECARRYGIPGDLTTRHGLWRYGFHGLAHRWMAERYCALTGNTRPKLITLQLGSGCSAAAIRHGRSVETSMGVTPSEGLMMATRSGDVDPSLPGLLAEREGLNLKQVEELLNKRSGLRGVDGRNREVPEIIAAARDGEGRANLAVDMFCHRVRKYVGAYLAVLGGADAIVFGGGIGENAPVVRARICTGMEWCGLQFDDERNQSAIGKETRISTDRSPMQCFVIPVNEEVLIARDTLNCLQHKKEADAPSRMDLCPTQSR